MTQTFYERRGAHRPPGLGPAGTIPWFIAAVAITLIVVYATGWWGGGSDGGGTNAASSGAVSGVTSTKSAGSSASKTPNAGSSSTPTGTRTTTSVAPTVDHSQTVSVLNATKRSGLAASAAAKLRNAGWTIRATGNYSAGVDGTTVFYGRGSLAATAEAVGKDLGGAVTKESGDFGASRVTVVLGADYQS
jgi:hypothetical protein